MVFIHGMAHVQLAGNVGRGHHDGKGLFAAVNLGMEIPFVAPFLIDTVLGALGIVLFGEFFCHICVLLSCCGTKKARPSRDVNPHGTAVPMHKPRYHPNCLPDISLSRRRPLERPVTGAGRSGLGRLSAVPPLCLKVTAPGSLYRVSTLPGFLKKADA